MSSPFLSQFSNWLFKGVCPDWESEPVHLDYRVVISEGAVSRGLLKNEQPQVLHNDGLQCDLPLSRALLKNEQPQVLHNDGLQCGLPLSRALLKNEHPQVLHNDGLQCGMPLVAGAAQE